MERMVAFLVLAPFVGGFLAGVDRKLSARLQGRYGPPLRQPFFDVLKLFQKERILVNKFQNFSIVLFFLFTVFSGALFFAGADLLLTIFSLALAGTFFILGGFAVGSPYSHLGAERELIQMVAYEPMVILMAVGMYQVTGSFKVAELVQYQAAADTLSFPGFLPASCISSPSSSENLPSTFPCPITPTRRSCAGSPPNFPVPHSPHRDHPLV